MKFHFPDNENSAKFAAKVMLAGAPVAVPSGTSALKFKQESGKRKERMRRELPD